MNFTGVLFNPTFTKWCQFNRTVDKLSTSHLKESPGVFRTELLSLGRGSCTLSVASWASAWAHSDRECPPRPPLQLGTDGLTDGRAAAGCGEAAAQFHPGLEAPDALV